MPMARPTTTNLRAIADATGLALATVSRILRGRDQCSEATRQRVLTVAEQLKYRPNLLVQGLQTGRTRTIGVLMQVREFPARIIEGIHDELVAADHVPIILWPRIVYSPDEPTNDLEQLHRLIDRRVDAVILYPADDRVADDYLHEVWDRGLPLVTVDRELEHTHADFVGTDDRLGGRLAAEHLLDLGHRHFGIVAGPPQVTTARHRQEGFAAAVATCPDATLHVVHDSSYTVGYPAALELLRQFPRPTALFADNDYQAEGVYRAAADMQLHIPHDLSVVGFADLRHAPYLQPPLTTLRQFPEQIGQRAARLVLDRLDGELSDPAPQRHRLAPQLIVRHSTAKPPGNEFSDR